MFPDNNFCKRSLQSDTPVSHQFCISLVRIQPTIVTTRIEWQNMERLSLYEKMVSSLSFNEVPDLPKHVPGLRCYPRRSMRSLIEI